jgi:hypothetical protein
MRCSVVQAGLLGCGQARQQGELICGGGALLCAESDDGQSGFTGQFEHVVAELKLADVGESVHLAPGAVLVNV